MSIIWAAFFVTLDILELWILGLRPIPNRYNEIKHYISVINWKQACKTEIHCDDMGNTVFHMGRGIDTVLFFVGLWILRFQATSP